jgi:hypothetical protein
MPIARFQLPDGKIARFEVPEGTTPEQAQQMMAAHFSRPAAPKETAEQAGARYRQVFGGDTREQGEQLGSGLQGFMSAMQGPTFGFGDEMAGAGAAVSGLMHGDFDVAKNYRGARDMYRGATESASEQNPILAGTTRFMTAAPVALPARAAAATTAAPAGVLPGMKTAAKTAAIYGGVSGAGESERGTAGGVLMDAGVGATTSAAMGGASVPVARGMGSAGRAVLSHVSDRTAGNYAKQKVGEALIRDARGKAGEAAPLKQADARLSKLGDDAVVADAGGQNTRGLLDVITSLPGQTKGATERLIRQRQAGRGQRIGDAADEALGTQNAKYVQSLEEFDAARRAAAAPYYKQLEDVRVPVDMELKGLLQRATPYFSQAEKLAKVNGVKGSPLTELQAAIDDGGMMLSKARADLSKLDTLKQSLYDAAQSAKREGNDKLGRSLDDLRVSLTSKLDRLSPKDEAGRSIYKLARDAWGGPSSSMNAAEIGRSILKEDVIGVRDLMRNMSASEVEAFRIGAAQAIKEKAGTMGGQNQLLRMWRDNATSDKLRAVFGNDYRKFAAATAKEERKKGLESAGRGSQTFGREAAAEDLGVSPVASEAGQLASGAMRGNLADVMPWVVRQASRLSTPESVRDDMGRLLLAKGPEGRAMLAEIQQLADALNVARARRAATSGAFAGIVNPVN